MGLLPVPTPRILGVAAWSYRRGAVFGAILVDLERRCPVDVLPGCTAATFCAWLQEHPGIEVIARDRGEAYVEGAQQWAPGAIQAMDRFHLVRGAGAAARPTPRRTLPAVPPSCAAGWYLGCL